MLDESRWRLVSYDKESDVTTIEFEHSILTVNGSPSPEACERFIKILSEMKAEQRRKRNKG